MTSETATTRPAGWLYPAELCALTSRFLDEVYSEELGLYPFTTSVVEERYVSDYRLPWAVRYTINTLLGRLRAARAGVAGAPGVDRVERELELLQQRHAARLGAGDHGLLLVLLAELGVGPSELDAAVSAARGALEAESPERSNLQDLSWLAWGAARAAEAGAGEGRSLARVIQDPLLRLRGSGALARHVRSRARADLVSFGSTVYYLRALHEQARVFGDAEARAAFERGVRTAISFQGPRGEWPWLLSVSRGHALDVYPVYSVHQLAMAMLFLLPALDDGAVEGVPDAIRRSYRWVLGDNELAIEFARAEPFIVFRSLERREPLPKVTRFVRASARSATSRPAPDSPARWSRVNPEWRSYEGGWLLYAWADRPRELIQ